MHLSSKTLPEIQLASAARRADARHATRRSQARPRRPHLAHTRIRMALKTPYAHTHVLEIGGGAAGCSAALEAHAMGARVLMVVKGKIGRSGATPLAAHLTSSRAIPGPYPLLCKLTRVFSAVSDKLPLPLPPRYQQLVERV